MTLAELHIQKGIQQGVEQGSRTIAQNLIREGLDPAFVARRTRC